LDAQRAQQPPSADPQQHFLLEAQLQPAPIELAGNPPMNGKVGRVIAIQQVKLHLPTFTCHARNQTEYPGSAISNRSHPRLAGARA